MGTQIATTGPDYGSLLRPRGRTQAQRDADAEAQRRSGDYSSNTATRNNAPSAGDQRGGENRGVSASRNFKAREKNSEYKDQINNLRQLRALATESNGILTFPTTELKNKWTNSRALAVEYENNNKQCDIGNSQACMLAGRGSFPTDYPSPFSDSAHFNANSYFGVGDGSLANRQAKRTQRDGNSGEGEVSVAVAGDGTTESSQQRVEREREEANRREEERIAKENADAEPPRPSLPPSSGDGSGELPAPPTPAEKPETTDGSGDDLKPKNDGTHSGASGGGDTDGSQGGASGGEPTHIVPLNPSNDGIIGYPRMSRTGYDFINYPSVFNNRKCL